MPSPAGRSGPWYSRCQRTSAGASCVTLRDLWKRTVTCVPGGKRWLVTTKAPTGEMFERQAVEDLVAAGALQSHLAWQANVRAQDRAAHHLLGLAGQRAGHRLHLVRFGLEAHREALGGAFAAGDDAADEAVEARRDVEEQVDWLAARGLGVAFHEGAAGGEVVRPADEETLAVHALDLHQARVAVVSTPLVVHEASSSRERPTRQMARRRRGRRSHRPKAHSPSSEGGPRPAVLSAKSQVGPTSMACWADGGERLPARSRAWTT